MKKIITITLALIFSSLAFSQVSYNQEFMVNTFTNSNQQMPSVAGLSGGGFVVCWESQNQAGNYWEIYAQIFDNNTVKIGNEFKVHADLNTDQRGPSVIKLSNGSFVICWARKRNFWEGYYDIYGQIFNESGIKLGEEFKVNTNTFTNTNGIKIARLVNNNFVVSWHMPTDNGYVFDIYAQIFHENGTKVGNEFRVNSYTDNDQLNPSIGGLNNGGFVISWQTRGQDLDSWGIYAQIFDENGIMVGNEFLVNSYEVNWQQFPSLCVLNNGNFVIGWQSREQDGRDWGIFAQMYDENGLKIREEFQVNTFTWNAQRYPSISSQASGGFVVSWNSWGQSGIWEEIYIQIFDENSVKIGNEIHVNNYTNDYQSTSSISRLSNGDFVICWNSNEQDGSGYGVFGKYYFGEPINHILNDFNLIKPELDATINYTNPNFVWRKASETRINFPWELTYDLYIDNDINFADPVIQAEIEDTTYQIDSLASGQTYFWKVLARNYYGDSLWSSDTYGFYIDPNAVVDLEEIEAPLPKEFELFQNYPNPFNPVTKIKFQIPAKVKGEMSNVKITVYDILGNEIATLVDDQRQPGTYEVEFSATRGLSSGIYFYTITAGQYSITKKMLLMK